MPKIGHVSNVSPYTKLATELRTSKLFCSCNLLLFSIPFTSHKTYMQYITWYVYSITISSFSFWAKDMKSKE